MTLGQFFFKYRSYTPLPLLIIMFLTVPYQVNLLGYRSGPTILSMLTGFVFVLLGELTRFWGVSYAGSETRTRSVGGSKLVTQGPFAYTRNPLYLGNILIYFGFGIMMNSLFPYLAILGTAFFIFQYHYIIKEEEVKLRDLFKEKYDEYYNSVNRLLPSLSPFSPAKQSKVEIDLKAGFRSEKRTLQANLTVVICIYIVYILINQ